MKEDVYQTVTNAIIEAIDSGQTADKYQMPWAGYMSGFPPGLFPVSASQS